MSVGQQAMPIRGGLPPVVLLHGWGGSGESTWIRSGWRESLQVAGRDVIVLDLPGHGHAQGANDPADYKDLAAMVYHQLPQRVTLDVVGYSLGAKLTLALAVHHPGLFRRVVVAGLGGNVFAPEKHGAVLADVLESGVSAQTPPALTELVRYGLDAGNDARRIAAVLRRPPNPVLTPEMLSTVRCPVLVVAGDRDGVAMPLDPLMEVLPHARSIILAGVDHLGLIEQSALRREALMFLGAGDASVIEASG